MFDTEIVVFPSAPAIRTVFRCDAGLFVVILLTCCAELHRIHLLQHIVAGFKNAKLHHAWSVFVVLSFFHFSDILLRSDADNDDARADAVDDDHDAR